VRPRWHGPLMICGFFGVVISIERAVAIGRLWAYTAPLLAGLGTAATLHGLGAAAPWFYLAGQRRAARPGRCTCSRVSASCSWP
jgi:hypothetical protein